MRTCAGVWRLLRTLLPTKVVSRVKFVDAYSVSSADFMAPADVPSPFSETGPSVAEGMHAWLRRQCELEARGL